MNNMICQLLIFFFLDIFIAGLGFITSLLFVFLVGVFVSSWMGATVFWLGEWLIKKMPFVRHIYSASKQISSAISPGNSFQKGLPDIFKQKYDHGIIDHQMHFCWCAAAREFMHLLQSISLYLFLKYSDCCSTMIEIITAKLRPLKWLLHILLLVTSYFLNLELQLFFFSSTHPAFPYRSICRCSIRRD